MSDFEIQIDDAGLMAALARLDARLQNLEPAFAAAGEILKTSIVENFVAGGRYDTVGKWRGGANRWQPLSPVTLARITRGTGDMGHRKILVGQGHLMNSINWQTGQDRVEVGTNLIYAAIHNFGGMAGRGHQVHIPARPFLVAQDEDIEQITRVIGDFITGDGVWA